MVRSNVDPRETSLTRSLALQLFAGVSFVFASLLLLAGCVGSLSSTTEAHKEVRDATPKSLVILHTNDFHGHIAAEGESAGAARIAAFFASQRLQHDAVLVLDAGDAISGTPVSTLFSGEPIFEVMNVMGYDAGLIGNHEFDHGFRQIEKFRKASDHPLLASTAFAPDGSLVGDAPSIVVERGGLRIGIIGVLTETTPNMITPLGNEGTRFAEVESALRSRVEELRDKVDVLVVLSHTGHKRELELAAAIAGIDVIVGGHSHSKVEEPVLVGSTIVAQAHEYGKAVGVLELDVTDDVGVILKKGYLAKADAMPAPDTDVASLVDRWEEKVSAQVDFEIAQSAQLIHGAALRSWMERVIREHTGADLAYYNAGGVRDAIRPGPVTARTIWNVEPFGNSIVTLTLSGDQVLQMLADNNEDAGIELDAQKQYVLATNNFVGAHVRRTFGDDVQMQDTGILVRDLLIDTIRTSGLPGQD